MNFRLTAILFSTIFVLGLGLLIWSFTSDDKPAADTITEELAGTKAENIDTVEFEREDGAKLKIVRQQDSKRWDITEPYVARADAAAVEEAIGALLKAKPAVYSGQLPGLALAGLQPPGLKVTLKYGEKSSTVNLGNVTLGSSGVVFVTTSARPKRPMAVSRSSLDVLFREPGKGDGPVVSLAKWVGDFRAKQIFPADTRGVGDDVDVVTLTAKGKTLSLAQSQRGWKFTSPTGWGDADPVGDPTAFPGSFTGVRPLLAAITGLQALNATDFVANPSPQDIEKFGLKDGDPNRITVDLVTKNREKTRAYIGKREDGATPPTAPGMPPSSKWWVQVEGQPGVIRANAANDIGGLAAIIENPDPLRDRNLLSVDKGRIDGIDLANGAVKLRKVGSARWRLYGNPAGGDPQPAAVAEADSVVNALTERRTIKSFPGKNDANFAAGTVTVKVWADGFEANTDPKADPKAEPKEKGKPTTLVFGKKEGDSVNVKRVLPDGTEEYFLLPEKIKLPTTVEPVDILAIANKPRLDLLERDLMGFSTTIVGKLIVQGTGTFDLDRDAADAANGDQVWRFAADAKGPAGQVYKKGDPADASVVRDMLGMLANTPSATRIVDESPTPEKLAEYGLGTATRLRVTVGLKSTAPDDKERVYEFGKETADPNFVYAQQRGKGAVFTLPKFIPDKFTQADLRNRSIFHVDPKEVAKIEITGWGHFGTNTPLELVAEKNKDGIWVATKTPLQGFVLDPNKIPAFLNALSSLRVEKFTPDNALEPKHGLTDPKQIFVVTLINSAGGHHLHLRLGGPADGTTLYALTSRLPDGKPIITVDSAPFRTFKEAPAAFAK